MLWRLSIMALLAPGLFFSTSRLIAHNSATRGYSVHPQQGTTGNLLDIIAGDTRTIIGVALLEKADAYYHGGIMDHGDCSVLTAAKDHDPDHHDHEHIPVKRSPWRDPWKYLNETIQTQTHIHLEREKVAELLPWYWAACEASPHNIQAFEAAAFALAHMAEKPQEALTLLTKGIQNNPYNVTLEISRGEILLKHFKNYKQADQAFLAAYQKSLHEKAPADDMEKAKALFYLGHLAKQRQDLTSLKEWQRIARETMSSELVSIRNLLEIKE